ncbi:hypothetical protein EXIGLDRAFT_291195 [Exidia glandulosa HHB12029]|uniref:Uncharacterized protein n=1 Tax=Exidia glandulosa HHB12029 TaxID=1314781 RepID=A0A165DEN6_EXIGL|nr:hypothetical protein EXIGLDRAFT_291195 [Exidia glandulosa HHB12029]
MSLTHHGQELGHVVCSRWLYVMSPAILSRTRSRRNENRSFLQKVDDNNLLAQLSTLLLHDRFNFELLSIMWLFVRCSSHLKRCDPRTSVKRTAAHNGRSGTNLLSRTRLIYDREHYSIGQPSIDPPACLSGTPRSCSPSTLPNSPPQHVQPQSYSVSSPFRLFIYSSDISCTVTTPLPSSGRHNLPNRRILRRPL